MTEHDALRHGIACAEIAIDQLGHRDHCYRDGQYTSANQHHWFAERALRSAIQYRGMATQ